MKPCGKHRHKSKEKAEAHLRNLVSRFGYDSDSLEPYYCSRCFAWHVGHVKAKTLERIKRKRRKGY